MHTGVYDILSVTMQHNEFNGQGNTSIDCVRASLLNNKQEVVVVAQEKEALAGFVCVQLKKSFCYDEYMSEMPFINMNS